MISLLLEMEEYQLSGDKEEHLMPRYQQEHLDMEFCE
jgi:hypothetical protein